MSDVWVVNASPVIVLAKAGYLELLKQLPSEVLLFFENEKGSGSLIRFLNRS